MPYNLVKRSGEKPYKIINKATRKQVGSSTTKAKAQASIRARYAGEKKPETAKPKPSGMLIFTKPKGKWL